MKELENFYLKQPEPVRSCYLALRDLILAQDINITNEWKYGSSFFYYKGKMFCYLWFHKKYKQPYISFVEGNRFDEPFLIQENRARMKIMLLNPNEDLPIANIKSILNKALGLYRTGVIKTNK